MLHVRASRVIRQRIQQSLPYSRAELFGDTEQFGPGPNCASSCAALARSKSSSVGLPTINSAQQAMLLVLGICRSGHALVEVQDQQVRGWI
jgi:hypothetical protein